MSTLDFVKDVHREQRLTRSLAWESEPESEEDTDLPGHRGAHKASKPCDTGNATHDSFISTHKRPGRWGFAKSHNVNNSSLKAANMTSLVVYSTLPASTCERQPQGASTSQ